MIMTTKFTNKMGKRLSALLPMGIPRWIRCYRAENDMDEFTVVYTGRWRRKGDNSARCQYVGMSANPYHPQGIGMHGEHDKMIDVNKWGFAPAMGRKCHLGTRIPF